MRLLNLWPALAALVLLSITTPASASDAPRYPGKLVGGIKYEIPGWFKESFLELADDAAEAAEADRHAIVFVHTPE